MTDELCDELAAHLAKPDDIDLLDLDGCPRGHHLTQEGDPERDEAVPWLAVRYAMHVQQDRRGDYAVTQ